MAENDIYDQITSLTATVETLVTQNNSLLAKAGQTSQILQSALLKIKELQEENQQLRRTNDVQQTGEFFTAPLEPMHLSC